MIPGADELLRVVLADIERRALALAEMSGNTRYAIDNVRDEARAIAAMCAAALAGK